MSGSCRSCLRTSIDVVPKLPVREAVRGEAVDDAVGIAELVVEAGADDALRQRVGDVADFLAHLIPDVRHLRRARRILQVDEDRRLARARVALQIIEARRLLQLAFDAVGDLLERVGDGGARPGRLHHHRLHGKVRVLAPPEPEVGPDARDGDDEHEIGHERPVPQRPFGEVEAHHRSPPSRRTFSPGCSVCTPAVTTISPTSKPLRNDDIGRIVSRDIHVAQRHGLAPGINHPHGRAAVGLGERARRNLQAGRRGQLDAAGDGGTQFHRRGSDR